MADETAKPIKVPQDNGRIVHSPKSGSGKSGAWIERDGTRKPAENAKG